MNRQSAARWGALALALAMLLALGCDRSPPGPVSVAEIASPAAAGSAQPHLAIGPDSEVILSWLEPTLDDYALKFSSLGADGWSAARTVAQGDDWFVNWADFPSVVPITKDLWAAHWLRHQPESFFAYDAMLALSSDGGASWQAPQMLHQDGTESEHGFVTLFPQRDDVGAVWLDGRNFIQDGVYLYEDAAGNLLGTGVHYARFDAAGERLESIELDDMACDCCLPDVALTSDGPVLVYRDRTTEEVRDIVIRRMLDTEWQAAVRLGSDNWVIEGCPINGPAVAAHDDTVAVAWFTAAANDTYVRLAQSDDAGRSFDEPIEIDAAGSFGYVDVAVLDSGDAVVSWLRSDADGVALVIRRVSSAGLVGDSQTVAFIDIGLPADFPQMVYADQRLVFAWTDFEDAGTVKTAVADISR
jgi:hypothetical protein